jgi:hypothetical protein
MNTPLSGPTRSLDQPKKNLKTKPSPIALWRPEIVLAEPPAIAHRPLLTPGDPERRPDATRAQLDGTRTLLTGFAQQREALSHRAAIAEARVRQAATDRERVTAVFEAYRVDSALDDVLTGTMKQLTSLMKDRGLR